MLIIALHLFWDFAELFQTGVCFFKLNTLSLSCVSGINQSETEV